MLRKFALIVAAGSAVFFSAAYGLGLGEIDVDSHLNQKFSASIPLNSVTPEEAENLLVRLADSDDFNKAGIERSDYLNSLSFKVVSDAKNSRIVISSKQLAREPFLSFLLDVRSASGRVLREYTVLLDPPAFAQPAPAVAATPAAKPSTDSAQVAEDAAPSKPAAAPAPAPVAAAPKPAPKPAAATSASAPAMPAVDAGSDTAASTYGPVKAQETFWSIASKLRPNESVTMDQMLWALYSANPQAFEGKRISGLLKGSTLTVPALSAITAVSPAAAKENLQELQGHRAASHKKAAPVASVEEPAPAPAPAPKVEPAMAPKPASKPAAPEKKTIEPVAPPAPAAAPHAKPAAPAPAPAPVPPPAPVAKAPAAAVPPPPPAPAPAAVTTPPPAAPPAPAAAPAPAPAPAAATPPEGSTPDTSSTTPAAAPAEPAPEPAPAPKPAKKSAEPSSSALADDWMAPAIAGIVVLVLALLGVRFWQKKQAEKDSVDESVLTSKASRNLQFWKRAAESAPAVPPGKFASPPPPVPPLSAKPPVAKSILDVPPPPPKPGNPLWDDTVVQPAATATASFDLTQTMDRRSEPSGPFGEPEVDEFNTTNQFEANTGKADHEANDPVAEADFHLAYGLYDEAALLLENAVEKNPNSTDIRVKLAETYFRANKPHEFEDIAQSLKPHLDAGEWQKIAIMGSQLLPDNPLYKGAASEAVDHSVDLAFDEPVDLGAAETKIFSSTATSMPSQPSARSSSSVLDFKLEDLEAPQASKSASPPAAPAQAAPGNTLEFNLSDFDLSPPSGAPAPAATPPPAPVAKAPAQAQAPAAAPAKPSNAVEFDLGGFDLEPAKPAAGGEDINLDDFDLGELADDSHAISAGDEAGTKLDLARAYVDMGDNDMARSLLTEVLVQGSEEQKTEAQALIQRLA